MNPYVFFVGCPRSGTTLLRRMGDAHPKLAVIGELHWLPRWWESRVGMTAEGIVTRELVDALLAEPRFRKLDLAAEAVAGLVEDGRPKHYARFVTELFDLHGGVRGKQLVGEKTPGYVRFLRTLNSLWPHARVVHLIRDGRDVALSLFDRTRTQRRAWRLPTWEEDPATTAALYWEWNVRLGREAGARLGPDRYCEVRYDALVADPELECQKLCDFLALDFDPMILRFHEGRTRAEPGLSAKKAWQPITPGLRKWQEEMAPGDVVRFEAAAGDLLEELGYERANAHASPTELASAARLRVAFADHARARRRPLPAAWESLAA
jgi:sulfotransferase family protein